MIARQWIGETRESDAEEYAKYLEETPYVIARAFMEIVECFS